MSVLSDMKVISSLIAKPIRGDSHAERLDSFYSDQAGEYDNFRKRLLKGREGLYNLIPAPNGAVWVEMGGGTGSNLELIRDRIDSLGKVYVVDLSPSLLKVASDRVRRNNWTKTEIVCADATLWRPEEGSADVVTFSYSLTMIPDWFAAIDHAYSLLKPGGVIAVVDFYVSRKYAAKHRRQHHWFTRNFWPFWFGHDNVNLSADHLPYLESKFAAKYLNEHRTPVPYLPVGRVPYYQFIGVKK